MTLTATPRALSGPDPSARAEAPPVSPARRRRRRREATWGALLVLPALALVIGVIAVPIVYLVRTSLTNAHAYLPRNDFIGLENYVALLAPGSAFWASLWTTVLYTVSTLALQIVLGVLVALLLHQRFRFQPLVRMFALLPYMIPAVVVALVWRWLLDGNYGIWSDWINSLAGTSVNFLGPDWIFPATVVVSVWLFTPFVTLSVLARLQTIDPSVVEASHIDGAGAWRRFWSITLPEIAGVIAMLALLRVMFMFTKFDIVYLFGGTGMSTRTLPILTFERIFGEARLGQGASIAIVMFLLLMIFTTIYLVVVNRRKGEKA